MRIGEQEDVPAQRIALQTIPRHAVQAFEAPSHVGGPGCQIDSRCSSPAEHLRPPPTRVPTVPAFSHRSRARLRLAVRVAIPPPKRYTSRRRVPLTGRTPPRPAMCCCQSAFAVPVLSGNGRACSAPGPAPGRTRSGSIRSIQTLLPTVRLLAGSAGAALHIPVVHSCHYLLPRLFRGLGPKKWPSRAVWNEPSSVGPGMSWRLWRLGEIILGVH